tara:strand:+ start:293 stop:1273 length:981 start_codon:yes stop_codon:yes gene_type:complete
MNKTTFFFTANSNKSARLDKFLTSELKSLSRSQIKKIILSRGVKVDKKIVVSASEKLKKGSTIEIVIKKIEDNKIIPRKINLDIIYEDDDIIIINKPSGLTVHPGAGNFDNTLVNALVHKYKKNLSDMNNSLRPGIVHRLDKDTSGLLVVAKNNIAHSKLSKQFSDHSVHRKYQCLIWGVIRPLSGKIESLIARDKRNRQLMTVSDIRGKKAITNYKTLKVFSCKNIPRISLLECELETGRTHQIRVHLKYKGSSIIGDKQYGKKNIRFKEVNKDFFEILNDINGQVLHAKTLEFLHPSHNKIIKFNSNLPKKFKKMLSLLTKLSS